MLRILSWIQSLHQPQSGSLSYNDPVLNPPPIPNPYDFSIDERQLRPPRG